MVVPSPLVMVTSPRSGAAAPARQDWGRRLRCTFCAFSGRFPGLEN